MHTQDGISRKLAVLAVMGSVLLGLSALATAQSDAVRALYVSAANIPTNISGIRTYAEPPKGFNAVAATDEELATYGFPPRPDKLAEPDNYAVWERVMKAAKFRWNGELKQLPGGGRRMSAPDSSSLPETVQPATSGPQQISTDNASGVILTNTLKAWNAKTSFSYVSAQFTVPNAQLPLDTGVAQCTASDYTELNYVGIDGFVFNTGNGDGFDPLLQGGVYADVNCQSGTFYYAVLGSQDNLDGVFQVNPGDIVVASMTVTGGPNGSGSVGLFDLTTYYFASYSISASGLVGKTAEWMVERLCCTGNVPYPLADTTAIAFNAGNAENGAGKIFYPGSQATTTEILTMTDDAGSGPIEQVSQGSAGYEGLHALWFQTIGCAFEGGCTP